MFCNRGIYHKGWTAVTRHSTPWVFAKLPAMDEGMGRLTENSVLNIKNKSYSVTAEIVVAQGGSSNGWSIYVKDGTRARTMRVWSANASPVHPARCAR
jgi:hypothetical protein